MSKRDRRDDGRDRDRRDDRRDRDRDWEDEGQQRRAGEGEIQEGDSLTALKAILAKVASLLRPLNLSADESIKLVEQLYHSVLDMDSAMAGEADDTRKSSTRAYIEKTNIRRDGDRLVVDFPTAADLRAQEAPPATQPAQAAGSPQATPAAAPAAPPARQPPPQQAPQLAPRPAPQQAPAPAAAPGPSQAPTATPAPTQADAAPPATAPAEPTTPASAAEAPARPPRTSRPRGPRKPKADVVPEASGQESGDAKPQEPRIDPADRGQAQRPEPEGPEA